MVIRFEKIVEIPYQAQKVVADQGKAKE